MLAVMPAPDAFQVLAEPRRRAVLRLVAERELTAGEIAARFDVTRQAISQHLRVLLAAGLVAERRDGARRWYRARPEGLEDVRAYLDALWPNALARLRTAAEAEHRSGRRSAGRN
jgi:DNA-binding transcriptional ArsR family regulator